MGIGQAIRRKMKLEILPIHESHRSDVVKIARELVTAADTYAFDPNITDDQLWAFWAPKAPGAGYVATIDKHVVGMFIIRPNHAGPAAHIANAGYAVISSMRGKGLGRQMAESSLQLAAELGFTAMQFNIVLDTNVYALRLWKSLGFEIIGTIPDGFRLPDGQFTSYHIMYRKLS
jgi:ribosomal protein S18 acetylase RimI-like enzyme